MNEQKQEQEPVVENIQQKSWIWIWIGNVFLIPQMVLLRWTPELDNGKRTSLKDTPYLCNMFETFSQQRIFNSLCNLKRVLFKPSLESSGFSIESSVGESSVPSEPTGVTISFGPCWNNWNIYQGHGSGDVAAFVMAPGHSIITLNWLKLIDWFASSLPLDKACSCTEMLGFFRILFHDGELYRIYLQFQEPS